MFRSAARILRLVPMLPVRLLPAGLLRLLMLSAGRLAAGLLLVGLLSAGLLSGAACASALKVATWNLNWLTGRPTGDPALPDDVRSRSPEDFALLRQYAAHLNADVIAIQEVDGRGVAARLFPPDRYSIHMTRDRVVQRVGIVVRRGLRYRVNPDVTGLDVDPHDRLRSGADITLFCHDAALRILAVHLKTGCPNGRLARSARHDCAELYEQIGPLQAWIAARRREGVPFLVLGDFNRHMDGRDRFWAALQRAAPLLRATEGYYSPCWGGEHFIDHIIAGGPARAWVETGTLQVMTYAQTGDRWKDRLSDHCPVSVLLH